MPALRRISGDLLVASPGRPMHVVRSIKRGAALAALALLWLPVSSLGDLEHDLAARRSTAAQLRASIAAETRRINATTAGVREAQRRLAALQAEVNARQAQLAAVQADIVAARKRLTRLENRLHEAATALAANLVASYKDQDPDVITVVLESHGFNDMLEQLQFMERIRKHDARMLGNVKKARVELLAETARLQRLLVRNRALAEQVQQARDAAAAVQGALLARRAAQLQKRASTAARLSRVRGEITSLHRQIARLSRAAPAPTPNAELPVDPGGMAQAPASAPTAVKQVIAAGNAIAGLPYLYGGGHGSFNANAYDCSGSVSYALAAAGLLSSPLDSTAFESWGEPGAGKWITVYANAGHAFMVVAGWRFDTSALSGGGTRWTRAMRDTGGFVARHPAGL
jgi:septal ring factor EnvC (AmiA/AmiB activator)